MSVSNINFDSFSLLPSLLGSYQTPPRQHHTNSRLTSNDSYSLQTYCLSLALSDISFSIVYSARE